jgi:hypothetical protein
MVCGIGFEVGIPHPTKFPHPVTPPPGCHWSAGSARGTLCRRNAVLKFLQPAERRRVARLLSDDRDFAWQAFLTMDMRLIAADHRLENDGNERRIEYDPARDVLSLFSHLMRNDKTPPFSVLTLMHPDKLGRQKFRERAAAICRLA